MWLENAEREAFVVEHRHEKRIDLVDCVFCPFCTDDICVPYQQALEDKTKKPNWCKYMAFIVGGDNE